MSDNERADALARQATTESNLTLDPETVLALVSEQLDSCIVDTSHTTLKRKVLSGELVDPVTCAELAGAEAINYY